MPQRVPCNVLVTLNVLQNSLARQHPCWRYYANLLGRLPAQPVRWYMTEIDYAWAFNCLEWFGSGIDVACQAAYLRILSLAKPIRCDEWILELAGDYAVNFCDGLRMACAVDHHLDVILTWEPHQFAQSVEERYRVQTQGYFYTNISTQELETGEQSSLAIGIYSVNAFLLHLDTLREHRQPQPQSSQLFRLETFELISGDDNVVRLALKNSSGALLEVTAHGNSPFDAIQRAVDQVVDQCFQIPTRYLSRFFITPAILPGADAPVEVVIGVECGELSFEQSACSGNSIRAAAEAYVKVINSIYEHLKLPIRDEQI